jgi:hypothetical protein
MAGGDVVFARLIAFAQYGVNAVQRAVTIFLSRYRARFKLYLGAVRKFDGLQRSEHAAFIDCMDRLHAFFYHVVAGNASFGPNLMGHQSVLGSAPNPVGHPQNILVRVPITG